MPSFRGGSLHDDRSMSAPVLPGLTVPAFDYDPRTRVVFGAGSLNKLGDFAKKLGGRRVLLVSDSGLKEAGHEQRALDLLQGAGMEVSVWDDVPPNPTADDIERGTAFARGLDVNLLVGLGAEQHGLRRESTSCSPTEGASRITGGSARRRSRCCR